MFKQIDGFAYKIQTGEYLRNAGKEVRILYCSSILSMLLNDPGFLFMHGFLMNATHFNGFINPQTPLVLYTQTSLQRNSSVVRI